MATTATRWVQLFGEGNASQRALLGGKGANLAEMTNAGLPVPPGFTITTEACNDVPAQWQHVARTASGNRRWTA